MITVWFWGALGGAVAGGSVGYAVGAIMNRAARASRRLVRELSWTAIVGGCEAHTAATLAELHAWCDANGVIPDCVTARDAGKAL